jgi:hypothetical protein
MSRNVLSVSFKTKEEDLMKFLELNGFKDNFSYYVKDLIRKDMKKGENESKNNEENVESCERNTNYDNCED